MKSLVLYCCVLASACWCQVNPVSVEVPKPISVKLETAPQRPLQSFLQFAASGVVVAISTLFGVWLTNRNNQRTNERQHQHIMLRWRADKQLEVLSRIAQLVVQTRHALRKSEEENARGVSLREVQAAPEEIATADEAARITNQDLARSREELAFFAATARFTLSDGLWHRLRFLEETFAHVRENVQGGDKRRAQLTDLDTKIDEFNAEARREFENLSRGSIAAVPLAT